MSQTNSTTDPDEEVIFESEIASTEYAGGTDTLIRVTDNMLSAEPIPGSDSDSALDFALPLEDIVTVECAGVLSRTITVETGANSYAIPANQLNRREFTSALAEQGGLVSPCTALGLHQFSESLCGWMTCLGCALILVGLGLSITVIGLFLGVPLIGLGVAILLVVALRGKVCDWRGTNTWRRPQSPS